MSTDRILADSQIGNDPSLQRLPISEDTAFQQDAEMNRLVIAARRKSLTDLKRRVWLDQSDRKSVV